MADRSKARDLIILAVDHKVRDLWRLVNLKVWLEDVYGYDARLVPTDLRLLQAYSAAAAPRIIFWHHMRNYNTARFVDRFHDAGIQAGLLHTEYLYGQASPQMREYYAKGDDWDRIDVAFVGHPEYRDAAREHLNRDLAQIRYVGNPIFDFYFPPYKTLLESRASFYARHNLDPAKHTLLIVTGFPISTQDPKAEAERLRQRSRIAQVWDYSAAAEDMNRNRDLMIAAMIAIAQKFPDLNLIWRPHPFEVSSPQGLEPYAPLREAGVYDRFVQVPEGFMGHVLNQADTVLTYYSSSSIEAWLLGLPVISLRPAEMQFQLAQQLAFLEGCDTTHVVADALDAVRHYVNGGGIPAEVMTARQRILDYHFSGDWQGKITSRIAAGIHEHLQATSGEPLNLRPLLSSRLERLSYRVKTALGLPPTHHLLRPAAPLPLPDLPVSERHASPEEIAGFAGQLRGLLADELAAAHTHQ